MEFLGTWELIYNQNFKVVEFDHFKQEAGLHTFVISASDWIEKTNAIGLYVKKGRYGGTFAHKDIAFEFASAISPVFKLYLIKEFQRLKEEENDVKEIEWNAKRFLSNLETHNAQMIREGKSKEERFTILKEIAKYQIRVLNEAQSISNRIDD